MSDNLIPLDPTIREANAVAERLMDVIAEENLISSLDVQRVLVLIMAGSYIASVGLTHGLGRAQEELETLKKDIHADAWEVFTQL